MMFLQRLLSSVILIKSSCVRPVRVLILSIQLILGLPLPRPPGTVPWMISFSKHDPSFLMMCPFFFPLLSLVTSFLLLLFPAPTCLFVFPSTIFALSFLNISSRRLLFSSPHPSSLSSLRIRILQPAIPMFSGAPFFCYFDIMALPDPLKICSYCIPICQSHPYLCGTVTVSGNCRSQIHEGVYLFQGFLIYPDLTCSPCCCHNLCLACVYLQTEFPPASFNLLVNVCNSSTVFAIRMISSAYLRFVIRLLYSAFVSFKGFPHHHFCYNVEHGGRQYTPLSHPSSYSELCC